VLDNSKIMTTSTNFLDEILAFEPVQRPANRFPLTHIDHDGDCLEVILTSEPYNGERIDGRVTIYRGIETGDVVGLMVKGLSTWIAESWSLSIEEFSFATCHEHN
jgi:hypothetical protein